MRLFFFFFIYVIIISHYSALNFICLFVGLSFISECPSAVFDNHLFSEPPWVTLNQHLTFSPPWFSLCRSLINVSDNTRLSLRSVAQTLCDTMRATSRPPSSVAFPQPHLGAGCRSLPDLGCRAEIPGYGSVGGPCTSSGSIFFLAVLFMLCSLSCGTGHKMALWVCAATHLELEACCRLRAPRGVVLGRASTAPKALLVICWHQIRVFVHHLPQQCLFQGRWYWNLKSQLVLNREAPGLENLVPWQCKGARPEQGLEVAWFAQACFWCPWHRYHSLDKSLVIVVI